MKKITIYKDLNHKEILELEARLKKSPIDRIAEVVALIRRIYPIKSSSNKRITFLK